MWVRILNKRRKKSFDVYDVISIGDKWEIDLEKDSYTISEDSILEFLKIKTLSIQSISYWFPVYEEPITLEYIEHWDYGNRIRGNCFPTLADNIIMKRIVSSGNNYRFPTVDYF